MRVEYAPTRSRTDIETGARHDVAENVIRRAAFRGIVPSRNSSALAASSGNAFPMLDQERQRQARAKESSTERAFFSLGANRVGFQQRPTRPGEGE